MGYLQTLEYNLMTQHGLIKGAGSVAIKNDLLGTFGVNEEDIATLLDQHTIVNEAAEAYEKCPPTSDQNVVYLLSFLKMLACTAGKNLAILLNTRIGNRKILLRWSTGWGGFPLTTTKANSQSHIMTLPQARRLNLNQLQRKFTGNGVRGFIQHCQTLFQQSPKGAHNDVRYLCLEIPAGPYTWHQIQAGITSKRKVVNYLSPHYVQFYHEGCHWVRILGGESFSVDNGDTDAMLCPILKEAYENAEEFYNIRCAPRSEGKILEEMGFLHRLNHKGGVIPSGKIGSPHDSNFGANYAKGDAILAYALGMYETKKISETVYERVKGTNVLRRNYC